MIKLLNPGNAAPPANRRRVCAALLGLTFALPLANIAPAAEKSQSAEKAKAAAKSAEEAPAEQPVISSVARRFVDASTKEAPDFTRHVVPLLGRLGCNGRSCHGSFQGQGGFRLSLFGYDVKADHEALLKGDEPRTNLKDPADSEILKKPTLAVPHEGGERMKADGWEHRLLVSWIQAGANASPADLPSFVRLDVTPSEINFAKTGDVVRLQAIAVWSDGRREDVTPLCRFQTNDETIAAINIDGVVTGGEKGDTNVVAFYDRAVVTVPVIRAVSNKIGPKYPKTPTPTEVDRLVVSKLQKLGMVQSELCTDAEFLRRVSLDMTGTLPTVEEIEKFLSDSSADKRERKIDELLERPAYAAWWATLFCDWTGNNPQQLNNVSPVQNAPQRDWYDWAQKRFAENMPYDQIVAGVVLAGRTEEGKSYEEYCREMSRVHGPNPEKSPAEMSEMPYFWARRNLRQPEEKALAFAYSFMGIRIQCAQCHKHPFDVWTQDDYKQFQNFFTRIGYGVPPEERKTQQKLLEELGVDLKKGNGNDQRKQLADLLKQGKTIPFESAYVAKAPRNENRNKNDKQNKKNPRPTFAQSARVLGGEMINLADVDDPRVPLMEWLRSPENPYFAKAIVNRVWANYFSVGIVDPPDDLSLANPPSNRELLDYLASEFIKHNFDLKWLHREIARSRTYQLSWVPNETNQHDQRNFSRSIPRRIPAEVAYDAVRQVTSNDNEVASLLGSTKGRAIGGLYTSLGREAGNTYALTVFGRSSRDSNCDCDRSMEPSLLQTVFLRNDQSVLQMIENPKTGWVAQVAGTAAPTTTQEPVDAVSRKQARQMEAELSELQKKLAEAKKSGDEKRIQKINDRLKQVRKQTAAVPKNGKRKGEEKRGEQTMVKAPEILTPEQIVRTAYLRSLGREPDSKEKEASLAFLQESKSLAEGTRSLLWALLNTKEFIVNH